MFKLLEKKNFSSLFFTQFFSALNVNLVKNIVIITLMYKIWNFNQSLNNILSFAIFFFMLPFFIFAGFVGQIGDKYNKVKIIRLLKLSEIFLLCLLGISYYLNSKSLMYLSMFLLGVEVSCFDIIKYSILPNVIEKDKLLTGNAYFEATNYLSIILSISFGIFLFLNLSQFIILLISLIFSAISYYHSLKMDPSLFEENQKVIKINKNFIAETFNCIKRLRRNGEIFLCTTGIAWFYFFIYTFIFQLSILIIKNDTLSVFPIILFCIGICIGAFLSGKILKNVVQSTAIPLGMFGMTIFGLIFYLSISTLNLNDFYLNITGIIKHISLLCIGFFAGIFIVPLRASIQILAGKKYIARITSASHFLNSFAILLSIAVIYTFKIIGFRINETFLFISLLNLPVFLFVIRVLPDALIRNFAKFFINIFFKVNVKGLEHYFEAGKKVIIVANHTSLIDGVLLAAYLPERITFVVNTNVAKKWWVKPFLRLIDYITIDPTNPMSTKTIIDAINSGKKCMIFPEGRISVTGNLMKVYEGAGLVADKTDATILPIRIKGAQYSKFAYTQDKEKTYWFPKISIKILPPTKFHVDESVKGRGRREDFSTQLYKLMLDMYYKTSNTNHNLFKSLINAKKVFGGDRLIMEDLKREPVSYNKLILRTYVLGEGFKKVIIDEKVGLMLPNCNELAYSFFGLVAVDKVPAMINFTSGLNTILNACKTAALKKIITSHKFIEAAELEHLEKGLKNAGIELIYLEDLKDKITIIEKAKGIYKYFTSYIPKNKENDPAVILFTSGSEGTPKGVVLSHKNIQSNRYQLLAVLSITSKDVFFSSLPLFHSFGLSTSMILPLLSGVKIFLFPSPLKYRVVPELSYDVNATVLLGTDTFLSGYAKMAHQYDFFNLRYAVAGAEKLKESTRLAWMFKFGIRVLEGYGATETSPVISINTPMYLKTGSVGKALPGIEVKLEKIAGINDGEKLWVKGDNVMLGYMKIDKPGVIQPLENDGWYDTGDVVDVDEDGFITIKGRLKRFAKIAGEMVSLGAVEFAINSLWEGFLQGVVVIPDEKKGEQLVLVTQNEKANLSELIEHFKKSGISDLWIPKKILILPEPPVLGSGKFDYITCQKIVLEKHEKGEI